MASYIFDTARLQRHKAKVAEQQQITIDPEMITRAT